MEDKEIVISKALPPCIFKKADVDQSYDGTISFPNQWQVIPSFPLAVYYSTSIDLSGYNLQDLTFFPELAFIQQPPTGAIVGSDGGTIYDTTVVSTVPLDMDGLLGLIITGGGPGLPNFSVQPNTTPTEWETIPYCRIATYTRNNLVPSGIGLMQPIDVSQIGSLQPTAVDKLFIYKIIAPYSNTSIPGQVYTNFEQLIVPACRVGFRGMAKEEAEIEYLMRLKRGYELANQVVQP